MTISKFCFNQGMTKEEFQTFKANIQATCKVIFESMPNTNGLYIDLNDYLEFTDTEIYWMIINELKKYHVEFIYHDTYTLFRN